MITSKQNDDYNTVVLRICYKDLSILDPTSLNAGRVVPSKGICSVCGVLGEVYNARLNIPNIRFEPKPYTPTHSSGDECMMYHLRSKAMGLFTLNTHTLTLYDDKKLLP